jgi:tRNA threonylcarbamoyl adenosine modification protein YeaZ
MPYALAIHTASPDLGLALSNFAGDRRCQSWPLGRVLSSHLHVYLMEFMVPQTWADLDFIAVAKGPGGFTGTRIGVVAARTLAQQLEIPLFGISTLAAIAWSVANPSVADPAGEPGDIAVWMRAQRGEVYGGIYAIEQGQLVTRQADSVMPEAQWQQVLANWGPCRVVEAAEGLGETAIAVLELAYGEWQQGDRQHWADVVPFYGQSPV